jgi:single-stranded-DNA-specific exonuclease
MSDPVLQWTLKSTVQPTDEFLQAIAQWVPKGGGKAIGQVLWQRGVREISQLAGYLNPTHYQPASPFEFGQEMDWAIARLQQAYVSQEQVAIWGDFDADGVTATSVLWDGLGQFFPPQKTLTYFIPNRLTDSHGLSLHGIDRLHQQNCRLIITCDTGSTNLAELDYAHRLNIDVIITDHHTLPASRPPVTAIINPRYLPNHHPLATLSGVAVAYKLVEALYTALPTIPQKPLPELLDLVAIGLIADLVELKGDCRYLAQLGIEQLQKQSNPATMTRPGVGKLLELCKKTGDRPTDISFGLGPRINAVSRIQGDAHFCVELLTSADPQRCAQLAEATELANSRRKALQKDLMTQVSDRLAQQDLSTTCVIVLADPQWQSGILGLVAGQIAQEYGRPTILLSMDDGTTALSSSALSPPPLLARGSARSVNNIDLYQLVKGQEHLLHRFGGHPFAAGLSLPVENLPLFTEAINQELRRSQEDLPTPTLSVDLQVTVGELGKALFQELKLLEPCGMGNPVPKLLIQNCWFANVKNKNIKDRRGQTVRYIKTEFELCDESTEQPFPGIWWGHYRDEVPQGRCDVVIELDSNTYERRYEARLIAVRPCAAIAPGSSVDASWILDWRQKAPAAECDRTAPPPISLSLCPTSWTELQQYWRRAQQQHRPLALTYAPPPITAPLEIWQQLVGVAKYLSRTGQLATRQQFLEKLDIGDRSLQIGFQSLAQFGFVIKTQDRAFQVTWDESQGVAIQEEAQAIAIAQFLTTLKEEQFRRRYFAHLSIEIIQAVLLQTVAIDDRDGMMLNTDEHR